MAAVLKQLFRASFDEQWLQLWTEYPEKVHTVVAPIKSPGAHLHIRFPDGVHTYVEDCQDRGAIADPI
jgi:hypothetical protein